MLLLLLMVRVHYVLTLFKSTYSNIAYILLFYQVRIINFLIRDNSFHSIFKRRYYRAISNVNEGVMDVKKKLNLARQCFHAISEETVAECFVDVV